MEVTDLGKKLFDLYYPMVSCEFIAAGILTVQFTATILVTKTIKRQLC